MLVQKGHPLAFISQGLKERALNLSTYEEMLAILLVVQKWRQYLLGRNSLYERIKGA